MKTSILQLEPFDDIISTRDKMGWSKSARILLVWPRRGRILRRRVDLVLIQRRALELGSQVALVTRDRAVIVYARELGLPVFSSVKQAQSMPWRARGRRPVLRRPERAPADPVELRRRYTEFHRLPAGFLEQPVTRFMIFSLGVLAVVILVLFFYPSARVELAPAAGRQNITLAVRASPSIGSASASGGLPARVESVVVEGQAETTASGQVRMAEALAKGAVQFANLTDREVSVPDGTVVRTLSDPPVRFQTTAAVLLPAGPGQSVEAPVEAMLPGSDGNVAAGAIQAVEGEIGLNVSAGNARPVSGGSERSVRAPSARDEARLREQLLATLSENALKDLARATGEEREALPASLTVVKILSEDRTPPEGQPADHLQLRLRVEYSAWTVRSQDVHAVALAALAANLPPGYQLVAGTLEVERFDQPRMEAGGQQAHWQIRAGGQTRAAWNAEQVAGLAMGKTPAEAGAVIANQIALQAPPRITLRPAWWVRMPYLAFRIQVVAQ